MKKYRQILAGFLAMNLAISGTPASAWTAKASSETISSETTDSTEIIQTTDESADSINLESAGEINDIELVSDNQSAGDTTEEITASDSSENTAESTDDVVVPADPVETEPVVIPTEPETSAASGDASEPETPDTSAQTEAPTEPSTSETPAETEEPVTPVDPEEPSTDEPVVPIDPSETEEPSSSDETEEETTEAESETETENPIATQAAEQTVTGKLKLKQFRHYNEKTKTIDIQSNEELILLSNCEPDELKNVTINLSVTGGNYNLCKDQKIGINSNLSEILQAISGESSTISEDTSTTTAESERTDSSITQGENLETGSEAVQTENETADIIIIDPVITSVSNEMPADASELETQKLTAESETEGGSATDIIVEANELAEQEDSSATVTTKIIAGQDYTFLGLGTEEIPFAGTIQGAAPTSLKVDRSFFGGLSSNAKVSTTSFVITWCGGGDQPMIANVYQFDSSIEETNHILPVTVKGDSTGTMGSLIGTVREAQGVTGYTLTIRNVATYSGAKAISATSSSGNAGLICNTLESGTICLDGFVFPTANYNIGTAATVNAGGVIGEMRPGTALEIKSDVEIHDGTIITASENAGGLVGKMQSGAAISTENGKIALKTPTVTGGISAGGVTGAAENVKITGAAGTIILESPTAKGSTADSNAGGFIGHYKLTGSVESEETNSYTLPECIALTSPTASTTGRNDKNKEVSNAGGYFGYLELVGQWNCTFGGESDSIVNFESTHGDNAARGRAYGAIAGKITSTDIASTVIIKNMTITSTYKNQAVYHGGLIGELGTKGKEEDAVYLETSNITVTVNNPYADGNERGFGGLVGCLAQGSILRVQGTTTIATGTTGSDPKIWEGGGIVGHADKKSVLELSGTTDLSKVNYVGNRSTVGWLVGFQDCALIYARSDENGNGWTYKRGVAKKQYYDGIKNLLNDICNYGQVIRLGANDSNSQLSNDLITISNEHKVTLKSLTLSAANGITLGSADDFALLSITWNSRGYFSPDSSITTGNWSNLKGENITLSGDINLTGSGITGLSRDSKNGDDDTYSGTFDGGGHTVTLAIGESFGYVGNEKASFNVDGGGKVYAMVVDQNNSYHAALGIFAKTNGATIKNLILAGEINFSNRVSAITAGGIAAFSTGTGEVDEVTAGEKIQADCSGANDTTANLSVGGLYGEASSGSLTLQNDTKVLAQITLSNVEDRGSYVYAGGVLGQITSDGYTLAVNGLTVGGGDSENGASITTDANKYAYVGGLVGFIKPRTNADAVTNTIEENRWIEIRSLKFNHFEINASQASEVCGGLFGSIWANVGVYFMGKLDNDEGEYAGNTKLTVQNSVISAPKAKGVGGLAYRSSGIWEIRDNGIAIQGLTIDAGGDVGLLVCRGEKGDGTGSQTSIGNSSVNLGALYVKLTEHWKNAYQLDENGISITQSSGGVFDEFVAYTAASADEITYNADNGIISLATEEGSNERVGVAEKNSTNCTTYQNQTAYGKSHSTNACSRYYYDLDECWKYLNGNSSTWNDNEINDPRELMLWSVYRYASANIKHFFIDGKNSNGNVIPGAFSDLEDSNTITGTFDMEKYSYYPIDISNDVNVRSAEIQFYNEQIEAAESKNKSTQENGTDGPTTQHYTMHCGLFLRQLQVKHNTKVTVEKVTFKGSIGKIKSTGASGALFANNVAGMADTQLYIATVELKNITLDGLKVYGCGENYAPLLINSIGSYTTLDVNKIEIKDNNYTQGTAVASSLIGNVGSTSGKQINLSFLNIVLPDKKAENGTGIFSHATLLESFIHDGTSSVATYNFYKGEEWKNGKYTHGVTYGKEITETTEYPEQQWWYYDEEGYYIVDDNRVHTSAEAADPEKFSSASYLPYVCRGFDEANKTHEIKVNQRVTDITHGCGTYSHPYKITSEREMNILSEYMSTGTARTDWRVTITNDQSTYHGADDPDKYTYSGDKTYQFDGTEWIQVTKTITDGKEIWNHVITTDGAEIKLSRDFMLQYLLNAYYDLQGTEKELSLTNFGGFGIATRPFRGVITSTTGTTVVLKGTSTSNGLIPYSYGSVVKNLTIIYEKLDGAGKTLTYSGTKTSAYYPDECFGGVIGCVLGGDNIIDNVTVTMDEGWLTLSGEKPHLIPVGGYVGSVSGGGVIFRNMTDASGLTNGKVTGIDKDNTYAHLYVNPYVGRVLDGFAFYEVTDTTVTYVGSLNNTDKNYRINTLDTSKTKSVTVNEETVTVDDAQGLLILSAIVNSGAASSGKNNAYSSESNVSYSATDGSATYNFAGAYGKVRNAAYDEIKNSVSDAEKTVSIADDQTKPGSGSMPYLIQKYCGANKTVFELCNSAKISLINISYDMTSYGTGYQGLGARYVSNAILQGTTAEAKGIIPELVSFAGSTNTVITIDTQVKEYVDDDFQAAAVGGIFNLLRVGGSGEIANLTISGSKADDKTAYSGVSLEYYDSNGHQVTDFTSYDKKNVDVGAVAGAVSGLSAASNRNSGDVAFEFLTLQHLTISGPRNAGGLLGSSNKTEKREEKENGSAFLFKSLGNTFSVGLTITNTSYSDITVTAPNTAGGFVGSAENDSNISMTVTAANLKTGDSSVIGKGDYTTEMAGGAFGCVKRVETQVKSQVSLNVGDGTYQDAEIQDVKVTARDYAGGFIGKIDGKIYQIKQAVFKGSASDKAVVSVTDSAKSAGGIVGWASGLDDKNIIQKSQTIQAKITEENTDSSDPRGVSSGHGGIAGRIEGAKVTIENCTVQKTFITGGKSGGVLGNTAVTVTIENCVVQGNDNIKYEITGSETAGGIIGLSNASGADIQIEQCIVRNMKMTSKSWGCGGMLGDVDWNAVLNTLYLFDCSVEKSEVYGINKDTTAGGFTGDIRGKLVASNLLLSEVDIHTKSDNKVGMVIGMTDSRTGGTNSQKEPGIVSVAGLSIQNVTAYTTDKTKTISHLYGVIGDGTKNVTESNMSTYSYFALADYMGTAAQFKEKLLAASETYPYVVTSPLSSLSVHEGNTAEEEFLYGDGASWSGSSVIAETIETNKGVVKNGHYAYDNTGVENFGFKTAFSTYNANQSEKENKIADDKDFPVLQITGGNVDKVTEYLDILTNGGFSAANKCNTSGNRHVTATAVIYEYDSTTEGFVKSSEDPAFEVRTDANGKISFSTTTAYDNDKNRFTLLKVTFTEKDADKNNHVYNVLVPVLVRRMLEVDFTATLTYGTDFRSQDYQGLTTHVLEGFGSPITGYLIYTYNSAKGEYTDYGWESYINAGGDVVASMNKSIRFAQNEELPVGTQLSLVDGRDGKVYYYTVDGSETDKAVPLNDFKASDEKTNYEEPSISELLQVTMEEPGENNLFIKVDEKGKPEGSTDTETKEYPKPTVKIKTEKGGYEYYRLADTTKKETGKYTVKVGTTSKVTEMYYLVITVPKNSTSEGLNGSIQTVMKSEIPHQIHYRTLNARNNQEDPYNDDHNNTASTYLISNGYQQTLSESLDIEDFSKIISAADSVLKVDVKDKITFPNEQLYNDNDQLYLRFVGGLQKTIKDSAASAEIFPNESSGIVRFYVYTESGGVKTYYKYSPSTSASNSWVKVGDGEEKETLHYKWTSTEGNMELPLSTDGTIANAVSLAGLRKLLKEASGGKGTSTFYVEVKMDVTLPPARLDVIPTSKVSDGLPENYTKLSYSSQLSTVSQSLTYSANRASCNNTTTAYYQEEPAGAKLTYEAADINQLGINPLDMDTSKGYALIETSAAYDLSGMKNLDAALERSNGIKFTLQLYPKNTTSNYEGYGTLSDAESYLKVELRSKESGTVDYDAGTGTWTWTVPKDTYWKDGNVKLSSGDSEEKVFNGSILTQTIWLKVNVNNVETAGHFYSNYKVILTAEILESDGDTGTKTMANTSCSDNIIYTLAKIKPEFIDFLASDNTTETSSTSASD